MLRASASVVLALAGCSGGNSGGDLSMNTDLSVATAQLCATAACASAPCTRGCQFQLPSTGNCPSDKPSTVATAVVEQCNGFCAVYGFPDHELYPGTGGCWHYDPTVPGACQVPVCGWNQACVVYTIEIGPNQAAICPPTEICDDTRPPPDASVPCFDLAEPANVDGGAD
jgi:hypothetical protein